MCVENSDANTFFAATTDKVLLYKRGGENDFFDLFD